MHFLQLFLVVLTGCLQFALARPQEIYIMCEREGEIAFTYDQGPSQYTGKLLSTLAKLKAKATFHVSLDFLENPVILAYLRKSAIDGHLIGIFIKDSISKNQIKGYLANASATLKRFTNISPQYLRFPAPGPDPETLKIVTSLGYIVTSYNLDSLDYNAVNESTPSDGKGTVFTTFKTIFDQILPPAKGSFISIQRDIVQSSIDQSEAIIKYALEKGYKPVRLDQCINKKPDGFKEDKPSSPSPPPENNKQNEPRDPPADNVVSEEATSEQSFAPSVKPFIKLLSISVLALSLL